MEAQKKEAVATIDYSGPALLPEKGHAYFIFTEISCIHLWGWGTTLYCIVLAYISGFT